MLGCAARLARVALPAGMALAFWPSARADGSAETLLTRMRPDSPRLPPSSKPKAVPKEFAPTQQRQAAPNLGDLAVFSGSSNEPLAQEVAFELKVPLGKILHQRFPDGEITLQVLENVRGKDVYIIQSTAKPVNENLMELLLVISTMRRASAKSITAVVPYFGYKRDVGAPSSSVPNQIVRDNVVAAAPFGVLSLPASLASDAAVAHSDGAHHHAADGSGTVSSLSAFDDHDLSHTTRSAFPVSAADVAVMLEVMGVDRVITVDLRLPGSGATEGFFPPRVPVENLRSTAAAVEHIAKLKPRLQRPVVVAPSESCIQLASDFQRGLARRSGQAVGLAAILEPGASRGADRYIHQDHHLRLPQQRSALASSELGANTVAAQPTLELMGDVAGRDVVIVDDIIDTGVTLVRRLEVLKAAGAARLVAYATHGLFNGSALARINHSALSDVIVTNTVQLREDVDMRHTHKIAQLSVAPLIAEAITRVQTGQSLVDLRVFDRDTEAARYHGQE